MKKFKIGDIFQLNTEFDDFIYNYGKYFVIYEVDKCTSLDGERVDYLFSCVGTRFKDFSLTSEELEKRLNDGYLKHCDMHTKVYKVEYHNESKNLDTHEFVLLPDTEEFRNLDEEYFNTVICDCYHQTEEGNSMGYSTFEKDTFKIKSIKEIKYVKM